MMHRIACCLILFFLVSAVPVSGQDKTYTIKTRDGVQYIHNIVPLWQNAQERIGFQFVQKIGASPQKDSRYTFSKPQDVAVDREGNLYILDTGNCRIVKYSRTGKYLAVYGKQGDKSGEFQFPSSIQYTPENTLNVSDEIKRCTMVLSLAGKELRRLSAENGEFFAFSTLSTGDVVSFGISDFAALFEEKPFIEPMLKIFDKNIVKKHEFCKPMDTGNLFTNTLMNEVRYSTDTKDNIYVIFTKQNIIDKYTSAGAHIWRADRQLNYLMIIPDPPEYASTLTLGVFGAITTATPGAGMAVSQFAHTVQADSLGRAWVYTLLEQPEGDINSNDYVPPETTLEIYDPNGILLARIPYPSEIKEMYTYQIFGSRIFFINRNIDMCVYEYKIIEK